VSGFADRSDSAFNLIGEAAEIIVPRRQMTWWRAARSGSIVLKKSKNRTAPKISRKLIFRPLYRCSVLQLRRPVVDFGWMDAVSHVSAPEMLWM